MLCVSLLICRYKNEYRFNTGSLSFTETKAHITDGLWVRR